MKIDIRDAELVHAIRPLEAAQYLRAKGWEKAEKQNNHASVWLFRNGDQEFEALLPMDAAYRDYAHRMGDLLEVLAAAENRSQWQVYNDLLMITSDVMRIRISDPEMLDGTLPIEEHTRIAQKVRDLVLSAACAATESRAVWHKRKPTQAMDHFRRVRIGQSERGSYVVAVITRITPLLHTLNEHLFETEAPFERKVTQTLAQSLSALYQASEQAALTQEMVAFDQAIPKGVNANLCDAVVGLWGEDEKQRNLEFSFSWSPIRPVARLTTSRVFFSPDRVPVIREAGRQLREREPITEFELHGPVLKLERPENSPTGKVTIITFLDERQIRVTLELDDDQYHRALLAHDQGKTIQTSGTLVKEGRGYVLKNSCDLHVDDDE